MTCKAVTEKDTNWNFCPSVSAAYLFAILFGLTTLAHIAQGIIHRKLYSWVIAFSGLLQTVGYVFRIASINSPSSVPDYSIWFTLILVAPLWTNAYVYMVFGRMVYNFTATARLFKIKAWRFGLYFVLLDILAFLIQLFGAVSATGNNVSTSQVLRVSQFLNFTYSLGESPKEPNINCETTYRACISTWAALASNKSLSSCFVI